MDAESGAASTLIAWHSNKKQNAYAAHSAVRDICPPNVPRFPPLHGRDQLLGHGHLCARQVGEVHDREKILRCIVSGIKALVRCQPCQTRGPHSIGMKTRSVRTCRLLL